MTKEELEKEAEKYADTVKCEWENDTYWVDCRDKVTDAYLASAEPREKRIAELEDKLANADYQLEGRDLEIKELEKENARLKDGITLKDEEVGCIETDFNTFKSKAKEIIKDLCGMVRELNKPNVQLTNIDYSLSEAEQFISEVEK